MKILQLVQATASVAATANATSVDMTMLQNDSDVEQGTVQPFTEGTTSNSSDFMAPFSTEKPSDLFERYDTLNTLAPIINVASELLSQPIPTNKWWGNFIHSTTDGSNTVAEPAWSNPYALKLPQEAPFGVQVCYSHTYRNMAQKVNGIVKFYLHGFHNDVTLSAEEFASTRPTYEIYAFSDMGVSLRTCSSGSTNCMNSFLVNGMAFVSATYSGLTASIKSKYAMTMVDSSTAGKYVIQLTNLQTWVIYSSDTSATFSIDSNGSALVSNAAYNGTLRMAILPDSKDQSVFDKYSSCIIRGGDVSIESRTSYSLQWTTEGSECQTTGLLHFALPHQVQVMEGAVTSQSENAIILHSTTRGQMVGQVTTSGSWILTEDESVDDVDFYPATKLSADVVSQINLLSTLQSDIESDWKLSTGSWYYNGKAYQKYASLCLMAADSSVVGSDTALLKTCLSKLEKLIEPFLTNTLDTPLAYDTVYKGIVTSQVYKANDINVEFGNGIYNDHHYHYGYWVTASAILKKLDPTWSSMAQLDTMVWTLIRDVANPSAQDTYFPKFRHFSWYLGHSYSHGVTPMADGKDEESTSEDMNFCYGLKLWGQVSGNKAVEDLGSLMLRLNARAVRTYFLMTSDNTIHPPEFVPNHVTGIFFDNKADYTTWFSAEKYCIHGIQMIPVLPVNGLARTAKFIKEEWDDILSKEAIVTNNDMTNAWLSLLLVNEAVINQADALAGLATATMDDGLTRSWALYNAASRGGNTTVSTNDTTPTQNDTISFPTETLSPATETPSPNPATPDATAASNSSTANDATETPSNTTVTPPTTIVSPSASPETPAETLSPATETPSPNTATPDATASDASTANGAMEIPSNTTVTPPTTTVSPSASLETPTFSPSPAPPSVPTATPESTTATPCPDSDTNVTTSGSWKDSVGQYRH